LVSGSGVWMVDARGMDEKGLEESELRQLWKYRKGRSGPKDSKKGMK